MYSELADKLKAISHPVRLCMIHQLMHKEKCNVSYMQQCLDMPQPTISQHLTKLKHAGLITSQRQGLEVYYRLTDNNIIPLLCKLLQDEQINTN